MMNDGAGNDDAQLGIEKSVLNVVSYMWLETHYLFQKIVSNFIGPFNPRQF